MNGKYDFKAIGRIFYGTCFTGIGVMHIFHNGFRGIIWPSIRSEKPVDFSFPAYIVAFYLIVSGILIIAGKKLRITSLLLACVLTVFLLFGHLPFLILHNPGRLGEWTNFLKLLALIGGALLVYSTSTENTSNSFLLKFDRFAPYGKYLFSIMLIAFGIDHFLYTEFVSGLIPKWVPFPIFWTWFTGVALLGSGIAIVINFKLTTISLLLAIMLLIWLFVVHIRLAIRFPEWNYGENFIGASQCLAFAGIALLIAASSKSNKV